MSDQPQVTPPQNPRIFPTLEGIDYIWKLAELHRQLEPTWYLEIGALAGSSLKVATGNSIAIDPQFVLDPMVYAGKEELHLFQTTSDAFFASGRLSAITDKLDFAFLDGMHLFDFLLRDFINTEKNCTKAAKIAMHDCIPLSAIAAERTWDRSKTQAWTGDVWKLVPILKTYRPDLQIQVFDCPPSGLTVVSNLDPDSTVLADNYEQILREYMEVSIETYGRDKLLNDLNIQDSRASESDA